MQTNQRKSKIITSNVIEYGKMQPQALDVERAVLGAMVLEPDKMRDVLEIVQSPDVFYSDANQRVYAAIRRIFDKGGCVDFMTVIEELRKCSELEMVGGSYYISELMRDVVSAAHIEEHSRIVLQKYLLRELIKVSGDVISRSYEESEDVFDILDNAQSHFEEMAMSSVKKDYVQAGKPADKVLQNIAERMGSDVKMIGIPSGFPELDKVTGGWEKTNLIILAARPAVGKTAFALNILLNAFFRSNVNVGMFSLEMSATQLVQRMLASMSKIELNKIRNANLSQSEFDTLYDLKKKIDKSGIYIDDTAGITSREMRIKAKKMVRKHKVGLIVIDYLQLMSGDTKSQNREQEISKICRDIKVMAKDLDVPIIALSQLNRSVESRGKDNQEPMLSDLRESGSIEQDADSVIFLYNQDGIKISVAKNRHDRNAKFSAMFEGQYQTFHGITENDAQPKIDNFKPF